jgi:hypothetical protein
MRTIDTIVKLLLALVVASTLSFAAMADQHETGDAGSDGVEAADAPPVDAAPPASDDGGASDADEEQN